MEEAYRGGSRTLTLTGPAGPRTYDVTIPPGVVEGQRIRLAGQGGRAGASHAGDLYLVVRIAPDPHFRLGNDIYVDLPVTPWEAVLGASVPVRPPAAKASRRTARLLHRAVGFGCAVRECPPRPHPATSMPR